MYLRFVLLDKHPDTGIEDGVFDTAYDLSEEAVLPNYERKEIQDLLRWFDENLDTPSRFNRTKSKGNYGRPTKGVSWFKSSAKDHVSKMHRLAGILRDHGHHVTMIKTSRPGYVVYEDDHQVVAEPFNDLRASS